MNPSSKVSSVYRDSVAAFLSPIQSFLDDESVSEVLVNGASEIFVERRGLLERVDAKFLDEQALEAAIRNIAQFVGRKIDPDHPVLDARLPDGSRVAAVLPPCSRKGSTLSIRKFSRVTPTLVDLVKSRSLSKDAARFLDVCLYLGKNLVVSGGTGSGKTTMLNVLTARIPPAQRLIIIEDSTELKVQSPHVVFFETKNANDQGEGGVSVRDLLRASLRLRPDRLIVGEVRGEEALDLITAMNTGHEGSMGTVHANSPYEALIRLETLSMMGGTQVPASAVRRQIITALHLIVQVRRLIDGTRKVTHITEVLPELDAQDRYQLQDLFVFVQKGRSKDGKILGELVPTGVIPSFYSEIEVNGLPFSKDKFQAPPELEEMLKPKRKAA